MQLALARAWVARTADGQPDNERVASCSNLSNALIDDVQYDEAMAILQQLQTVFVREDPRWIRIMSKNGRIRCTTRQMNSVARCSNGVRTMPTAIRAFFGRFSPSP